MENQHMKKNAKANFFILLVASVIVILIQVGPSIAKSKSFPRTSSALGWGLESGRASETDIEALIADQIAIKMTMTRVDNIVRERLSIERVYSLLGGDPDVKGKPTIQEMMSFANKWWDKEVLGAIKRIARNPAASCAEAQDVFELVLGRERQMALLGVETKENGLFFELLGDVQQRCHEEALDECNLTGRFEHLLTMAIGEDRQLALIGAGESGLWIGEALKECANYELHYVSTTQINDAFNLNSVIDGKIKIKPIIQGNSNFEVISNLKFEGETNSAVNPFLQKLDCSLKLTNMTCSPGGSPAKTAWASLDKLEIKSKEFYTENEKVLTRPVGKDNLEITFSPAMISAKAVVRERGMTIPVPFLEVGATGFYIAHQKQQVSDQKYKFTETQRNGYPILFEFIEKGVGNLEGISATDSTVFRLIHKPEKKPFESKTTPVRKPLVPKPAPKPAQKPKP